VAAALTQLGSPRSQAGRLSLPRRSGGLYGLLLAFGMYFPRRMVMLIFRDPDAARYFVISSARSSSCSG